MVVQLKKANNYQNILLALEKHTKLQGQKAYIARTNALTSVLGVSISKKADEKSLTQAYSVFKDEAGQLDPNYSPKTVNVDGWQATINAWLNLFLQVFIISCFFHVFLSLKQKTTKHTKTIFTALSEKLWNCYQACNKSFFLKELDAYMNGRLKIIFHQPC